MDKKILNNLTKISRWGNKRSYCTTIPKHLAKAFKLKRADLIHWSLKGSKIIITKWR